MSWPQNAYVGQEVVCIDLSETTNEWHLKEPLVVGSMYRVQKIYFGGPKSDLYFVVDDGTSRYWLARCFRPVQSTSTGYEMLAKLQNPKNHKHLEDA